MKKTSWQRIATANTSSGQQYVWKAQDENGKDLYNIGRYEPLTLAGYYDLDAILKLKSATIIHWE